MLKQVFLTLSKSQALHRFTMRNRTARRAARRFVAGERLDEAIGAVADLNRRGMVATLDYLGEHTTSVAEAEGSAAMYRETIAAIAAAGVRSHVSLKLTQLGLDVDPAGAERRVAAIAASAAGAGTFVRIDMESSAYVERTLDLHARLHAAGHENVGVVIQSYLRRSDADLAHLVDRGVRVRLVKGAYAEPPEVAYPDKRDVDEAFRRQTEVLLLRGAYPAIATHDEAMIEHAKAFARRHAIEASRYEFQLLYGVRRDLQERLVRDGYTVRVYVPFGEHWYPYLMRRLAERPANVAFVVRALFSER